MMKKILIFILLGMISIQSFAQIDTIRLLDKRLNTASLKTGLNQYLVYFQTPAKNKNLGFWFWLRNIKRINYHGENVFSITQHWYGSDTSNYRFVYSINRVANFEPIYHKEVIKNVIKAYNWNNQQISGADSVKMNAAKGFSLDFAHPTFNWNLDIETFEMLPLSEGKTFAINFYDAGLDPPAFVVYKVIGSEKITTLDNQKTDCWILRTESNDKGNKSVETYWISKKEHEFLKEEDSFNGIYRYKIKLLSSAVDLLPKFSK